MRTLRPLTAAFALMLTLMAEPAIADIVVVDRATARGDYAVATASGTVDNPRRLWVKVKARPNQRVDVYWLTVCSKGYGAGSKDGDFSGLTPLRKRIGMPYRRPDSCTVSASAQLSGRGRKIIVIILARVPG
jgi:hypothetical protein